MQEDAVVSRRVAVSGAAALGVSMLASGVLFVPVANAFAGAGDTESGEVQEDGSWPYADDQLGFLVRTKKCTNCQDCVHACVRANKTPLDVEPRRKVTRHETPTGEVVYVSTSCMHCADPACAKVCPAGAISKGDGGIVTVDYDLCIGCKYCHQACPFEVPHYTDRGMDKCDCCLEVGVELGKKPNCVQACKFRALNFGTFGELMELSGGHGKVIECETDPSMIIV